MADFTARTRSGATSGRTLKAGPQEPKPYYDIDPDTGCWMWNRSKGSVYGTTRYNGRHEAAHRVYYAHYVGPVPAGMVVMHQCDTPKCVNPKHLQLGTHGENMWDRDRKGRQNANPGHEHATSVITKLGVRAVFALRDAGWLQSDIAEMFGVSRANISQILGGKRRATDVSDAA